MLLKFTTESEWLAARKQDITSTEVAALFGMSPHKSRLKLWMEKAGRIESDFEDNPFTKWGRRLQNAIGTGIAEDEGWEAQDLALLYLRCPECRLGASMDFLAISPAEGRKLLEVKSTTYFDEEAGWFENKAPIHYEFQIQTQLHLAIKDGQDIQGGVIGALDGRKNTKVYRRTLDRDLMALVEIEAKKFWRSIELNEPPAPDYLVDSDLIRKLQGPIDLGRNISLTGNNKAHQLIERYLELSSEFQLAGIHRAAIKEQTDSICNEIHHLMGKAEIALIGDYRISAPEITIDQRLQKEYSYRRFDVKKLNRKGK